MIALVSALLIATSDTAPPCCKSTNRFDANSETRHVIGHIISPAVATASIYGLATYYGASKKQARIVSVAASLSAVFAKELYDQHSAAHNFSWKDIAWGAGGTGTGLLIAEKISWLTKKKLQQ